jgi:pimeloyl-ACP methyl ester carboxylesterase
MRSIVRNMFAVAMLCAAAAGVSYAATAFTESDITLQTPTGNIFGTLALPSVNGPVPVVLLISGSGPTDRDGNSALLPGKVDTLKELAVALAQRGIASVRYDKRGIAASAAALTSEKDVRFDTYVGDAEAWIAMLHADPRFSKIIVAGHSEGSLIGMIASQRGNVAAFVSLEGAGRPAYTVLREQLKPGLSPALLAQMDAITAQLRAGSLYTGSVPPELQALFRPSIQPYLVSWFKYDPAVELGKLTVPATIVQGTADVQVSMADAQALKRGDPGATFVVVQGMNHVLKIAPDISSRSAILAGYVDPKLQVAAQVIDAVASAAKP